MRETKFRAWDINRREMVPWETVLFWHDLGMDLDEQESLDWVYYMQYTGLKDKQGKEIYEGDILDNVLVVRWDRYGWYPFTNTTLQGQHVEVTSNIYESPELLSEIP